MRLLLLLFLVAGACSTHARRLEAFRERYGAGEFAAADAEIDRVLAKESGVDADEIRATKGLAAPADEGDVALLLLEKAMVQIALGEPEAATPLLRSARDVLDEQFAGDAKKFFGAVLTDDRRLVYRGADYEHVMVRVVLCLCDLMVSSSETGGDAYAYALQVGEKQEQILESSLGSNAEYEPRKNYKRVGIGAYLQGMILEATGAPDGAALAYERCAAWEPGFALGASAVERTRGGRYAGPGEGVLHVFYLAGPGPYYVEGNAPATDLALRIAEVAATIVLDSPVPILQADVPVPVVAVRAHGLAPLRIDAGVARADTERLLDVNQVSDQQLEAMMPLIVARAILRRAVKTATLTAGGRAVRKNNRGAKGEAAELGFGIANLIWTAAERADTRIWSSLPAEIQVARLVLPEGERDVRFGGATRRVRIRAGRDSYAMVLAPGPGPGAIVIDRISDPERNKS